MNTDKILQLAQRFEKLAQQDPYDTNFRNLVINTKLDNNSFSFREVASVVLADLSSLDRSESDPNITSASHGLLDILNSLTVPDPSNMLNAVKTADNIISQKFSNDPAKQKISKYLVNLTQRIINKYFSTSSQRSVSHN